MRLTVLCALAFALALGTLCAQETASVRAADGFQLPVGENGSGLGYYVSRGVRANGHLGEDWNGQRGGDTDLGDPIYAIAHGIVVFAKNYHVGWGNVVIIRHAYYEGFSLKFVDSLYGHLLDFKVREGQQVQRGQLIGRLGSNHGMYDAHLHFEMRKNLQIGMYRSSFPRDFSCYWSPSQFIAAHRTCSQAVRTTQVPVNTFPASAPPSYAAGSRVHTPVYSPGTAPANPAITSTPLPPARRAPEPAVVMPPPSKSTTEARPAPVTKIAATKGATPKPAAKTATAKPSPPLPDPIAQGDAPPEPTVILAPGAPIRRGPSFRVDRFQDMREPGK